MVNGILHGLRVIDFTWVLAGPYATRVLGDFGAEVIKVQSRKTAKGAESNLTGYFNIWNRNKRSITLDMGNPDSRELILRLAKISDVVIENFTPRVMTNWGLNYEDLRERNPSLIMVSMSAMGQTGPWKDYVAFGPTIHALSGLSYLTSFCKELPLGPGQAYGDHVTGLYAALTVLAALENRSRTGLGGYVDLSGYEALCTLLGPTLLEASVNRLTPNPQGNRPDYVHATPHGCYRCLGEDRWCVISVSTEGEWEALCKVMGFSDWLENNRFKTFQRRKEHETEIDTRIGRWTTRRTPGEVVDMLQGAGVPAGAVQDARDLVRDQHLAARQFFIALEHSVLGRILSDRSPIRFENDQTENWKAAPQLGEDNYYVFVKLLGLTEEELAEYVAKGIIA